MIFVYICASTYAALLKLFAVSQETYKFAAHPLKVKYSKFNICVTLDFGKVKNASFLVNIGKCNGLRSTSTEYIKIILREGFY